MLNFDDFLTVHPTELNIPYELNKESSCSFQLTNKSDVLVGCRFSCPWGISISPELGIILPQSTCSFTVTKELLTEPPEYTQYCKNEIDIRAFVGKDGVKAEDLTNENFRRNTNCTGLLLHPCCQFFVGILTVQVFHLPVVYSYIPAANSSSAVTEKNEKATLLDDNLIRQFTSQSDHLYVKAYLEQEAAKHQSTSHSDHLYGKTHWDHLYGKTAKHQSTSQSDHLYGKAYLEQEAAKHQSTTHSDHLYGKTPESKGLILQEPLQPSNNEEMQSVENSPPSAELVIPSTGGYESTSRRKSEDTRVKPSFKTFSPKEIEDATNNFNLSLMIGQGGYGKVYKCQLDNWDVAVKILDNSRRSRLKRIHQKRWRF